VRRAAALVVVATLLGCHEGPQAPFADATDGAGLGDAVPSYDAALADFDGDGRVDVYVGNHGAGARLYRNLGGGRFADVTAASGIAPGGDQHGAGWGDADGDGRPDLYVSLGAERGRGTKANRLYRNAGARFDAVPDAGGATDPQGRARGVTWVDYDRDGRLDLFVANYASPNALFHNDGDGHFTDHAEEAGVARPGALRAVWTDVDGDGWPDVLFSATPDGIRLLRNGHDGRFRDTTRAAGLPSRPPAQGAAFADLDGDGDLDLVLAAGVDYPDHVTLIDGTAIVSVAGGTNVAVVLEAKAEPALALFHEGKPFAGLALVATGPARWRLPWPGPGRLVARIGPGVEHAALEGAVPWEPRRPHRLFQNRGDGTFAEVRGAFAGRGNGQAVAIGDVDDDGDLDVYVVQSGVEGADEPDALYLNDGAGRFTATRPLPSSDGRGCGAHFADLDGDGRLDLLLTTGWGVEPISRGRHRLLRNVTRENHWLGVVPVGVASNRAGLGAWLVLEADGRRQVRFRTGGALYSQSVVPEHFGLGRATHARLTVRWPSGAVETVETDADRTITVNETE
jgi:hypothetical protein